MLNPGVYIFDTGKAVTIFGRDALVKGRQMISRNRAEFEKERRHETLAAMIIENHGHSRNVSNDERDEKADPDRHSRRA